MVKYCFFNGTFGIFIIVYGVELGASVYHFVTTTCRVPSFVAYPIVVIAITVSGIHQHHPLSYEDYALITLRLLPSAAQVVVCIGGMAGYLIPAPANMIDPDWESTDDAFDDLAVINFKVYIVTGFNCAAMLLAWYK